MKAIGKFLLLSIAVLIQLPIQAQKPFYHNIGDTLEHLDTIYWRPAWYDRYIMPDTFAPQQPWPHPYTKITAGEILMQCYTDKPLQVIGIAGSVTTLTFWEAEFYDIDTLRRPEYFRLYQGYPNDSLALKLEFQYNLSDPHRTINILCKGIRAYVENDIIHTCDSMKITNHYYPIYEYYTEGKPITITDTFYIGGTDYSICDEDSYTTYPNIPEYMGVSWGTVDSCKFPELNYRFTNFYDTYTGIPAHNVYKYTDRSLMYTFPILLIDTSFADTSGGDTYVCPEVKRLRAANTWESGGVMLWDAEMQHCMWQLRLCNAGGDVENPLIDTLVHTAYHTFGGLQPETHYDVYIRAYCEHYGDTLESDWSGPVDLYTVFQNTAIDQPSDALVQLMPNPAGDHVQVVSCFPLRSVELYDLQGKPVLSQQAEGVSTVLDVSRLSRGTYIAVIRNQGGTSTKKLILN